MASEPVVDNQRVKKGDLLFCIDARPYQQAVERARSGLTNTVIVLKTIKSQYQSKPACYPDFRLMMFLCFVLLPPSLLYSKPQPKAAQA